MTTQGEMVSRAQWSEKGRRWRSVTLWSPPQVDDNTYAIHVSVSLQWCQCGFTSLSCSGSCQHLSKLSSVEMNSGELTKVWSRRLTHTSTWTNRVIRIFKQRVIMLRWTCSAVTESWKSILSEPFLNTLWETATGTLTGYLLSHNHNFCVVGQYSLGYPLSFFGEAWCPLHTS